MSELQRREEVSHERNKDAGTKERKVLLNVKKGIVEKEEREGERMEWKDRETEVVIYLAVEQ